MLNSPKNCGVVRGKGAGCGMAVWRNPSQGVVLVEGLLVNLPLFGFPSLLQDQSIPFWVCMHLQTCLRPLTISFLLKIVSTLSMIQDAICVTVNLYKSLPNK